MENHNISHEISTQFVVLRFALLWFLIWSIFKIPSQALGQLHCCQSAREVVPKDIFSSGSQLICFTKTKQNKTEERTVFIIVRMNYIINPLRPRQNDRHFTDDTLKRIFLNENVRISIKISLKFAPKASINNIPALVQIMAWRRPGDKPLSESMMVSLLTHICVTRPQWVKSYPLVGWYWNIPGE